MKKKFTTQNGHEGMSVDCGGYEVTFYKSIDGGWNNIEYNNKLEGDAMVTMITPFVFVIDWEEEAVGGKLSFKFKDRWGSEMYFSHFDPSDLKGLFDFIGYGYFKDKFTDFKNGKQWS